MKTSKNTKAKTSQKANKTDPPKMEDGLVEFKADFPDAKSVALAGTFNAWNPERTPLHNEGHGHWRVFLPLNPGRYEYRYIVDGQWQTDPQATESTVNPFGGQNSVIVVRATETSAAA
jgi:chromosome partitioning protein